MPHERPSRTICATAFAFAASAVIGPLAANAQALGPKTAEQEYKNITALKGVPADQLMPAMNFISTSLGVSCEFCHTMGKFAADDKGAKKTARETMAMQAMINKESVGRRTRVTWYSCHRGSARPVNMPPIEGTATTPA